MAGRPAIVLGVLAVLLACAGAIFTMWWALRAIATPPAPVLSSIRTLEGLNYRADVVSGQPVVFELRSDWDFPRTVRAVRIGNKAHSVRIDLPPMRGVAGSSKNVWRDNKVTSPVVPVVGAPTLCIIEQIDGDGNLINSAEHTLNVTVHDAIGQFMPQMPMNHEIRSLLSQTSIELSAGFGLIVRFPYDICDSSCSCALGLRITATRGSKSIVVARCYCGSHAYGNLGWNILLLMTPEIGRVITWPDHEVIWTIESDVEMSQRCFLCTCLWSGKVVVPSGNVVRK